MTQMDLIPQFDGATYQPEHDLERLSSQLDRVKSLMLDGRWRTLSEIAKAARGSEAGVSARLRDLRKLRFGGYTVNQRRESAGLWKYQVLK